MLPLVPVDCPIDVVFMVDVDTEDRFKLMKTYLSHIVTRLDIDGGSTRVGLLTFTAEVGDVISLTAHSSLASLLSAIWSLTLYRGVTNTSATLHYVRTKMLTSAAGNRNGVRNTVVVVTDGHSPYLTATVVSCFLFFTGVLSVKYYVAANSHANGCLVNWQRAFTSTTGYPFPTRGLAVLDKIYTNSPQWFLLPVTLPAIGKSGHSAVLLIPTADQPRPRGHYQSVVRRSSDPNGKALLYLALKHHNWTGIYSMTSSEEMTTYFYTTLLAYLDYFLLIKPYVSYSTDKPWINKRFKELIKKRQMLIETIVTKFRVSQENSAFGIMKRKFNNFTRLISIRGGNKFKNF